MASDDDEELELLRAEALRSKRSADEGSKKLSSVAQQPVVAIDQRQHLPKVVHPDHGSVPQYHNSPQRRPFRGHGGFHPRTRPNSNLIVIQTVSDDTGDQPSLKAEAKVAPVPRPKAAPAASTLPTLIRPQDKWQQAVAPVTQPVKGKSTKFNRYNDSSSESDDEYGKESGSESETVEHSSLAELPNESITSLFEDLVQNDSTDVPVHAAVDRSNTDKTGSQQMLNDSESVTFRTSVVLDSVQDSAIGQLSVECAEEHKNNVVMKQQFIEHSDVQHSLNCGNIAKNDGDLQSKQFPCKTSSPPADSSPKWGKIHMTSDRSRSASKSSSFSRSPTPDLSPPRYSSPLRLDSNTTQKRSCNQDRLQGPSTLSRDMRGRQQVREIRREQHKVPAYSKLGHAVSRRQGDLRYLPADCSEGIRATRHDFNKNSSVPYKRKSSSPKRRSVSRSRSKSIGRIAVEGNSPHTQKVDVCARLAVKVSSPRNDRCSRDGSFEEKDKSSSMGTHSPHYFKRSRSRSLDRRSLRAKRIKNSPPRKPISPVDQRRESSYRRSPVSLLSGSAVTETEFLNKYAPRLPASPPLAGSCSPRSRSRSRSPKSRAANANGSRLAKRAAQLSPEKGERCISPFHRSASMHRSRSVDRKRHVESRFDHSREHRSGSPFDDRSLSPVRTRVRSRSRSRSHSWSSQPEHIRPTDKLAQKPAVMHTVVKDRSTRSGSKEETAQFYKGSMSRSSKFSHSSAHCSEKRKKEPSPDAMWESSQLTSYEMERRNKEMRSTRSEQSREKLSPVGGFHKYDSSQSPPVLRTSNSSVSREKKSLSSVEVPSRSSRRSRSRSRSLEEKTKLPPHQSTRSSETSGLPSHQKKARSSRSPSSPARPSKYSRYQSHSRSRSVERRNRKPGHEAEFSHAKCTRLSPVEKAKDERKSSSVSISKKIESITSNAVKNGRNIKDRLGERKQETNDGSRSKNSGSKASCVTEQGSSFKNLKSFSNCKAERTRVSPARGCKPQRNSTDKKIMKGSVSDQKSSEHSKIYTNEEISRMQASASKRRNQDHQATDVTADDLKGTKPVVQIQQEMKVNKSGKERDADASSAVKLASKERAALKMESELIAQAPRRGQKVGTAEAKSVDQLTEEVSNCGRMFSDISESQSPSSDNKSLSNLTASCNSDESSEEELGPGRKYVMERVDLPESRMHQRADDAQHKRERKWYSRTQKREDRYNKDKYSAVSRSQMVSESRDGSPEQSGCGTIKSVLSVVKFAKNTDGKQVGKKSDLLQDEDPPPEIFSSDRRRTVVQVHSDEMLMETIDPTAKSVCSKDDENVFTASKPRPSVHSRLGALPAVSDNEVTAGDRRLARFGPFSKELSDKAIAAAETSADDFNVVTDLRQRINRLDHPGVSASSHLEKTQWNRRNR